MMQFLDYGTSLIGRIIYFYKSVDIWCGDCGIIKTGFLSTWISASNNFSIVGLALIFLCILNGIKERTKFIFYLSITVAWYINLGFRYRLFLLFLPLALIYFL